jgi:hypothetical protein
MTTKELKAVKSLRPNKDTRSLQLEKRNCTLLLDQFKYNNKLKTLLESRVYEPLSKEPTAKVEWKVEKVLLNTKLLFLPI